MITWHIHCDLWEAEPSETWASDLEGVITMERRTIETYKKQFPTQRDYHDLFDLETISSSLDHMNVQLAKDFYQVKQIDDRILHFWS